jgi:hypothetical protein
MKNYSKTITATDAPRRKDDDEALLTMGYPIGRVSMTLGEAYDAGSGGFNQLALPASATGEQQEDAQNKIIAFCQSLGMTFC